MEYEEHIQKKYNRFHFGTHTFTPTSAVKSKCIILTYEVRDGLKCYAWKIVLSKWKTIGGHTFHCNVMYKRMQMLGCLRSSLFWPKQLAWKISIWVTLQRRPPEKTPDSEQKVMAIRCSDKKQKWETLWKFRTLNQVKTLLKANLDSRESNLVTKLKAGVSLFVMRQGTRRQERICQMYKKGELEEKHFLIQRKTLKKTTKKFYRPLKRKWSQG